MKSWKSYKGHNYELLGNKKKFDSTIYTLDIETSSYIILDGKVYPAIYYEELTPKERDRCIKQSNMYIWMFSINEQVYYGRTWEELRLFLTKLYETVPEQKFVFVHNLSFEFQYLKSILTFSDVFARTPHKPMKATCKEFNIEYRCSYMMSNCALAKLPKLFKLPVKKMVGDLDYSLIRHSNTPLTKKELGYCENDCLVVYEYIKYELQTYDDVKHIPVTSTGHVRRELQNLVRRNYSYKRKVAKSVNTLGHIYNLLIQTFAGGFTHANFLYTDLIINNVVSWDFTSSYPFCLCVEKYPMTKFTPCRVKRIEDLKPVFAYLLVVRFTDIHSNYFNNFLSKSKCLRISGQVSDNGRIIKADEIILALTDVDLGVITKAYSFSSYEILESYHATYKYLPIELVNFILDKYVFKTRYKDDKEHELEYAKEKSRFNSIYGMCVTNTVRPEVDFVKGEWVEIPMTNKEILEKLQKEEKDGFLSFSWGVWCTSYARRNLQENIMKLDKDVIYCDTDSLKLAEGYNEDVIKEYNKSVEEKIQRVAEERGIPIEKFKPKDINGVVRTLGVFDCDGVYLEFITQGAKKYAVRKQKNNKETGELEEVLEITVSGVPKSGVACLKGDLNNFRDDLMFDYKNTNKNTLLYCEGQESVLLEDYLGNTLEVNDSTGICILPTSYILGKAEEYMTLLNDSTDRQLFKESLWK